MQYKSYIQDFVSYKNGENGENGLTPYVHIKYATYSDETGYVLTDNNGEDAGDYIGYYADYTEADSQDVSVYHWSKIKGDPGTPGDPGDNGLTSYFHVKYSAVESPTSADEMTETPSKYIGTYVDFTEADSNDPSDYKWSQFIGNDGDVGPQGEQGIQGENGENGKTYYLHIKYSNDGGETFTDADGDTPGEVVGDYIGQCVDENEADPADPAAYKWSRIKGEKGEDGTSVTILGSYESEDELVDEHPAGTEGDSYLVNGDLYVWTGSEWQNVGSIQGPRGENGTSSYLHVKYGNYTEEGGYTFADNGEYIGQCVTTDSTAPTDPAAYTWTKIKGADGANGLPSYLHIKYSDDGTTFTDADSENPGETMGAWIGTLVDNNEEASKVFDDYTWKKFTEDVDEELTQLTKRVAQTEATIEEHAASIESNVSSIEEVKEVVLGNEADEIVGLTERMSQAESDILQHAEKISSTVTRIETAGWIDSTSFETYKSEVSSRIDQTAGDIEFLFEGKAEQAKTIEGLDEDLQSWKTEYAKHISFSNDGIIIGSENSSIMLTLDNENGIAFQKKGEDKPFGYWDGNDFHTGNIVVGTSERVRIGDYAFVPRSDGSLMFLKVGG